MDRIYKTPGESAETGAAKNDREVTLELGNLATLISRRSKGPIGSSCGSGGLWGLRLCLLVPGRVDETLW